ncbi:hypothetical protein FRC07_006781 [Ceratobasidium sp. 392]|nr:hypothetical protein FRC07_006781 [Ceratobasidium sp. 392]
MNLRNVFRLPHQRHQTAQRNEFFGSSLTSSGFVSERILEWSGSNNRKRLLPMTFHEEWQHDSCPVMRWYSQQRKSGTRFRSIEHRRNVEGPFYHEFLLLRLTDGAVCRVERTGEGSRTDAIRHIGCKAHDLIQWLSRDDYDTFSTSAPSVLIAEVDFDREFDILDVLAVCYSIQRTKLCRVYTLQRYNCYFLCLTVLAVLARRVASWETKISEAQWDSSLESAFEGLNNLSPEESMTHIVLRVCSLLEPDNPCAGQPLLDGLRTQLRSCAGALDYFNDSMGSTLWHTDWNSGTHSGLFYPVENKIAEILSDDSYCTAQLRLAVSTSEEDAEHAIGSSDVLARCYLDVGGTQMAKRIYALKEMAEDELRMWKIEHHVPFGRLALNQAIGYVLPVFLALAPNSVLNGSNHTEFARRLFSQWSVRVAFLKCGSSLFKCIDLMEGSDKDFIKESDVVEDARHEAFSLGKHKIELLCVMSCLGELAARGVSGPSAISLVLAYHLNEDNLAEQLVSLVEPGLNKSVFEILDSHRRQIGLTSPENTEAGKTVSITAAEFQSNYIKKRIEAHAKRVAQHRLAAAPLVVKDIESTMARVWKQLPSGFSSAVSARDDGRSDGQK